MVFCSVFILLAVSLITGWNPCEGADDKHAWSYDHHNGPHDWPGVCSSGKKQSPIDLDLDEAEERYFEPLVFFQYHASSNVTIKNNGHTLVMSLHQPCTAQLAGGGLRGPYTLAQVHFHWGSEHTVDDDRFPLEAHFVHYDSRRFQSVSSAVGQEDGLAVLGVLFKEHDENNAALANILNGVTGITQQGTEKMLSPGLKLENLLPHDTEKFFRYSGSLTTPNCNEGVVWTVLQTFAHISRDQVEMFKLLKTHSGKLELNYRPVQPLNDRSLYVRVDNAAVPLTISWLVICACALITLRAS